MKTSKSAAHLLIEAYARGEGAGEIDWYDLDLAFEKAREENPGYYEECLERMED